MRKNLALIGAVIAAGLVSWNEYRIWSHRSPNVPPLLPMTNPNEPPSSPSGYYAGSHEPVYFRPDPDFPLEKELSAQQGKDRLTGEEECDATIIDLTLLQQQTIEPPLADTIEPPIAPDHGKATPTRCDFESMPYVLPSVPQFRPFSADPDDCCAKGTMTETCRKVSGFLGSIFSKAKSSNNDEFTPEELHVMPRPVETQPPSENSGSPHLGSHQFDTVRYHRSLPDSSRAGEEEQLNPPMNPKTDNTHKQPKIDTMEIRPGDLPFGGLRKAF
jgi:hypothetical protein